MRSAIAVAMMLLLAMPALAQPAAPVRYTPDFFAAQNPKTALDMVQWIPGFNLSEGDATVRGFSGSTGNVLIDGERPPDKQFTLTQILQRIARGQVAYIEVIRSAVPGIDMLGQPVLANVVRRKDGDDSAALTLADAQYVNGHNLPSLTLEGTRHGGGGQVMTGAISLSRYLGLGTGTGPQLDRDASGAVLARNWVRAVSGGTTGFAYGVLETPFQGGHLRLNGNVAWTDFYRRTLDQPLAPAGNASLLTERLGGPGGGQFTAESGAAYTRDFGGFASDTLMLLHLNWQTYASRLGDGGQEQLFAERDHSGEAVLRTQWQHALGKATAQASLEGAYNWLGTASSYSFGGFAVPLPNALAHVNEARGEAAVKLDWPLTGSLQLEAGLRLEYSRMTAQADTGRRRSLFYPKPRLILTFAPNAHSQLRLRAEREVSQLDFTNFIAASALDTGGVRSGNTDILPQESWVLEAGYEYHFWDGASAGVTTRHSLIAHVVDRVPVRDAAGAAAFDAPGDIGSGRLDALELQLTLPLDRLGLNRMRLKGAATLQWSAVNDPTTGARRDISDIRPVEYSLEFRHDLPAWRAAWGATLATSCWNVTAVSDCSRAEYRFNEIDNYAVEPLLGLFAEYQPQADLFLRAELGNLLGAGYDRLVERYAGPRDRFSLTDAQDRRIQTSPFLKFSLRRTL